MNASPAMAKRTLMENGLATNRGYKIYTEKQNLFWILIFWPFFPSKQVDERKPKVIRVAAVPIYNSFMDVYKFYKNIKECYGIVYAKQSR